MVGFRVNCQRRILETSSVQKDGFINAPGENTWEEKGALGHEEWPIVYFQAKRGLGITQVSKEFWKAAFQDLERD